MGSVVDTRLKLYCREHWTTEVSGGHTSKTLLQGTMDPLGSALTGSSENMGESDIIDHRQKKLGHGHVTYWSRSQTTEPSTCAWANLYLMKSPEWVVLISISKTMASLESSLSFRDVWTRDSRPQAKIVSFPDSHECLGTRLKLQVTFKNQQLVY